MGGRRKPEAGKILRLPKSNNGHRREHSFGGCCYGGEKEELKRRALARGVSVNRYLNELLWRDQWWRRGR